MIRPHESPLQGFKGVWGLAEAFFLHLSSRENLKDSQKRDRHSSTQLFITVCDKLFLGVKDAPKGLEQKQSHAKMTNLTFLFMVHLSVTLRHKRPP